MMPSKPTLLRAEEITYQRLTELLGKLGFVEHPSKDPSKVRVLAYSTEPDWVFLFPGGERFCKPVDEWTNVRVHLDHWGILEAKTVEDLVQKLQEGEPS